MEIPIPGKTVFILRQGPEFGQSADVSAYNDSVQNHISDQFANPRLMEIGCFC